MDLNNKILDLISFDARRVKVNSRDVAPGDIFIAIKGAQNDGHMFVDEALKRGAVAVLCEYVPESLKGYQDKLIIVDNSLEASNMIAGEIFKKISAGMRFYGVTGTNGKTTTVYLIHSICEYFGDKCGLLSTVHNIVDGKIRQTAKMTTQNSADLNRYISDMARNGKTVSVIEMSSHALAQGRVSGIELDAAVFTNITPEHLDYHMNMKNYLNDKIKIFERLNDRGVGVVNVDDDLLTSVIPELVLPSLVTFGINNAADVMARDIRLSSKGCEFILDTREFGRIEIRTDMIGLYNVYNILSASAVLLYSGYAINGIKESLETGCDVPGRLDKIFSKAPFDVFVDYAHTPDALKNVLGCLKGLAGRRLLCVFGCGGDRDKSKRPLMGEIAAHYCDKVVVTDDNPRNEDPGEIVRQVEKGMIGKDNYCIIQPREKAIREIIDQAVAGDIVLIAGKGHENYQIIGKETFPFEDKEIAREELKSLGHC